MCLLEAQVELMSLTMSIVLNDDTDKVIMLKAIQKSQKEALKLLRFET